MRGWRAIGAAAAVFVAGVVFLAAMVEFLAPDLAYGIKNRAVEIASGKAGKKYRIALGAITGSGYLVGTVLNRHIKASGGYELELLSQAATIESLFVPNERIDSDERIDLAIINSAQDDAITSDAVVGLAALDTQYFFVMVPDASPVSEFRDLLGPVNPGARNPGRPPTLGERVLDYYGLASSGRVSVVRPERGTIIEDFEAGRMTAATRTQALHSELIDNTMRGGGYRLVPIADHEALARSIPGAKAGFIPPGLYGPERRIPSMPVPTITVTQLLIARADLPARVARDILEALYDPLFAREVQYELNERSGQDLAGVPLHPAAEIYYHRNDAVTADRLGRVSFLLTMIAALVAGWQFIVRFRRQERVRGQRQLLATKLATLRSIRHRIEQAAEQNAAETLIREADNLLCDAELDHAADRLDGEGILALRSLHRMCWLAMEHLRAAYVAQCATYVTQGFPLGPRGADGPSRAEPGATEALPIG